MWIDTHAHLYSIPPHDLPLLRNRARSSGVHCVINTATSIQTARIVLEQTALWPDMRAAVGISPFDVLEPGRDWPQTLRSLAEHESVLAIGEIGLDASSSRYPPLDAQAPIFQQQLELAIEERLPAVIHSRGAEQRCIDTCTRLGVTRALFHCFTGATRQLKSLLDAGYYISFSGIVTFKKNNLAELVRYAPMDRICIETDTPYLAPTPFRGKPNEPAHIGLIGEAVARAKNLSIETVRETLAQNAETLFGSFRLHC
jgi:TatD DNase family protein